MICRLIRTFVVSMQQSQVFSQRGTSKKDPIMGAVNRGSYVSAHILLNLLKKLRKKDKI